MLDVILDNILNEGIHKWKAGSFILHTGKKISGKVILT